MVSSAYAETRDFSNTLFGIDSQFFVLLICELFDFSLISARNKLPDEVYVMQYVMIPINLVFCESIASRIHSAHIAI